MLVKIYKYSMFLLILAILALISAITNSVIEMAIMMTCFLVSKGGYEFKYHCKSSFQCVLLSVSVFAIGLRLTLPTGISYTCSGICGLSIAHVAQYIARLKFIKEDYEYIEPKYNDLVEQSRKTNFYSMNEEELRVQCRANLLDDIDEEIVVQRLIYHRKGKDLYEKIGYSKPQMIRREKRIEEKLNIKLKQT